MLDSESINPKRESKPTLTGVSGVTRAAIRGVLPLIAFILLIPSSGFAQTATGTINGSVTDSTGAVIPGAQISIVNAETGVETATETGINGAYAVPNMPPGQYNISASAEGFKTAEVSGLRLNVASEISQTFALEIGAVTEVVEVSAEQLQIQTTSGSVGGTVNTEQILELPLPNRDIFNLVNLVPGASRSESNGYVSIGGGRTRSAGSYIDGVNNTRGGLGVQNIEMAPPVDSMQEFKVEVNSMGAEYGRSSAGLVQALTRSGTNDWHGSIYHYVRNDAFDAAGWNQDSKPKLRRNNPGASIGGPIEKNKTFFFYNVDVFRQRVGAIRTRSVGLPEFRIGNFSRGTQNRGGQAVLVPIHDPLTRKAGSFTRPRLSDPFPNNTIPMDRLDPVAVKVASYLPDPNRTPNNLNNLSGNWRESADVERNRDYHTFKIDHNYSDKWRTFLRVILTEPDDTITGYTAGYGVADPNGLSILNRRQNWGLNNTYTFNSTFFVTSIIGFNRVSVDRKSGDCCETNYADLLGLPGLEKGGEVFPRMNIQGGRGVPMTQLGAAGNANRIAVFTNFDYEANFTKIMGNHTFKFGGKYTSYQGNEVSRPQPSGAWRPTGQFTGSWGASGGRNNNTGITFADFMLGNIWNLDTRVAPGIGKRIKYYSGYFQNDWRVTPRLTVNLGVRYETETPIYEVGGRMNGFCQFCPHPLAGQNGIPEDAIGRVLFPNRDGTGKYLWQWDKNNLAPRFGFAYRLREDSSLVLRGGFGIFYGNPYDRNSIQPGRAGFDNIFRVRGGLGTYMRDGVPAGALDDIPEAELNGGFGAIGTRFPTSTIQFWDQARVLPYNQNFNLTLQTRWKGIIWEFGVMGALGRHQAINNLNINHIHPSQLAEANESGNLESYRPWVAWQGTQDQIQLMSPNWGISNYYAGTFKSEKRYRNGLGWTVAYTHTQWIDNIRFIGDADTFGDNDNPQNIYDFSSERSSSVNRMPHRLVVAPIYDLPFGRGRRWGSSIPKALNYVLGGWQISTLGTIRSGGYLGVNVDGGGNLRGDNAAGVALRPNLTGAAFKSSTQGNPADGVIGFNWLNEDAFENPAPYTLGDAGRTLPGIRGPGRITFDLMLGKNFTWGRNEKWRAQFRWEAYDFTNTPAFNIPNTSFGSGSFGLVVNTLPNTRRIMQLGLRISF